MEHVRRHILALKDLMMVR